MSELGVPPSTAPRRRVPWPPAAALAVLLAVLALLAGCGGGGDPLAAPASPSAPNVVRVGSANFTENRLLAEIYATGLERRGVTVERRFGIGSRETYFPGLQDGSIDLVPDYTGNLLRYLDKSATAVARDEVYQQAAGRLPPSLKLLAPSRAEDKDTVAVTRAFAAQHNLRTMEDLVPLCPTIAYGSSPEGQSREGTARGLLTPYGCMVREFRALDAGGPLTVAALRNGQVSAANLFTTDPQIPENDFVALEDSKGRYAAQDVVPLVNAAKANDPRVTDVLGRISAALDTPVLLDLNRRLAGPDRPDAAQVARDWLTSIGVA